jgi:hypothetical protein
VGVVCINFELCLYSNKLKRLNMKIIFLISALMNFSACEVLNTDAKFSRDDPVIGGITFGGTAEFGIARDGG